MKNIVGKYIPGNSIIHRLDPRIKLGTNIIFIVLVFITDSFLTQAILLLPILLAFLISGLRKWQLISMIKPVLLIGIFLFLINLFVMKGKPEPGQDLNNWIQEWHFTWELKAGPLTLNYATIKQTTIIMLRIYVMILVTSLLTATTKPMALTKAIEDFMLPLKLIRVPVHIIAMIISIALRFIPTLIEEAQRIMKAQASRGVDFKNGNIKSKAKSMVTLIIPLFVSAFAKAEDLGNAMETRGYDPYEKRTRYKTYPIKISDVFTFLLIAGLITFIIVSRHGIIDMPFWWAY